MPLPGGHNRKRRVRYDAVYILVIRLECSSQFPRCALPDIHPKIHGDTLDEMAWGGDGWGGLGYGRVETADAKDMTNILDQQLCRRGGEESNWQR